MAQLFARTSGFAYGYNDDVVPKHALSNNFFSKAEQFVLRLALLILLVIALGRLIIGEFHR